MKRIWILASCTATLAVVGCCALFVGTHLAWGTTVNGIAVGAMTTEQAHAAVTKQLQAKRITLSHNEQTTTVRLGDLGAEPVLASGALGSHTWFHGGEVSISGIRLDAAKTRALLTKNWKTLGTAPTEPSLTWSAPKKAFEVTAGVPGTGIDTDALAASLASWFRSGAKGTVSVPTSTLSPKTADAATQKVADAATKTATSVTIVGGSEKTTLTQVPANTVASWMSYTDGAMTYNRDAIQAYADTLPSSLNHTGTTPGTVVVNSSGKTLQTLSQPQNAIRITSTNGLGTTFAQTLSKGQTALEVPAEVTPAPLTQLYRHIDVDLTTRVATLYENDQVVKTFPISSGKTGYGTSTGDFKIYLKYVKQTMDGSAYGDGYNYLTPDVPWVSYFNGGEAFHGAPWNNQIGSADLSHGCVNMNVSDAEFIYNWAPVGTQVHVHK